MVKINQQLQTLTSKLPTMAAALICSRLFPAWDWPSNIRAGKLIMVETTTISNSPGFGCQIFILLQLPAGPATCEQLPAFTVIVIIKLNPKSFYAKEIAFIHNTAITATGLLLFNKTGSHIFQQPAWKIKCSHDIGIFTERSGTNCFIFQKELPW